MLSKKTFDNLIGFYDFVSLGYKNENPLGGNMKAKWYMLGCLSSIVILVLFVILSISSISKLVQMPTAPRVVDGSVLHLKLTGALQEYSTLTDMNFDFLSIPGMGRTTTAHDVIQKVNTAKNDSRIRAILLEPFGIEAGSATIHELIIALENFRESGKKVYGYINNATQNDIFLLSAADEVFMNPSTSAGFMLHGVGGNFMYIRDMLEKIGVTVHIVRAGAYKTAGEELARRTMSPELRRNLTEVYADRYAQLVGDLARNFDTTREAIIHAFERSERFFINQEHAVELRIVDELMHFDRFLKTKNISENQLLPIARYQAEAPRQHMNRIAVVYMLGNITPMRPQFGENNISSERFVKIFDRIERDNNIKAVVLRINSPGGSAMESEAILNKIGELRLKKPVIVSMGNVAASGGYYIATNANYIFASPYTITGSIGVVSMIPDLSGAASKLGVNTTTVGHGRFLPSLNIWNMYNRDIERALQIMTNDTYDEFKTRVSEGRGIPFANVEAVAAGRIFSAQRALEHGLIDAIGTLDDAIRKAAEIASIQNYSMVYYPQRRTMFELLMEDSFNFPMARAILRRELPTSMARPASEVMNLFEDIQRHPVQMRSEFLLMCDW